MTDSDTNQEPVEEPTPEGEAPPVEASEPSLDDIISEFAVPAPTARQQVADPVQPAASPPSYPDIPSNIDLMDPDNARQFVDGVTKGQSALRAQLAEMQAELSKSRQREAELQVEGDINAAVKAVNTNLDLDPRVVRAHLEILAQDKPGFKTLWERRNENPKAFKQALGAVKKELSSMYKRPTDPTLAETQAALRQSQQTLASRSRAPSEDPIADKLASAKSDAEFNRLWADIRGGY